MPHNFTLPPELKIRDSTAPIFESLKRAVERGVKVRVLFDHVS